MSGSGGEWETYSRLVLQQLEDLSASMIGLRQEIQELKVEIAELRAKETNVSELKMWKEKMDEVCSPSQLKSLREEVDELKVFKAKAITVFAVIQFAMGMAIFLEKFI